MTLTTFFAFADTVTTRSYRRQENGRGWVGIRFQASPHAPPSEIIVHVHLLDTTPEHQREALGVLGVNLIRGALFARQNPSALIATLMDDLSRGRVEVDMIRFSGPAFPDIDNRLMALQLVQQGLTDAAMLEASGDVVQPSDVLHKKPILVERGSFRPATKLTSISSSGPESNSSRSRAWRDRPRLCWEMTLKSLAAEHDVDHADFLARADILRALGLDVLISRSGPYYELADYLAGYTDRLIGMAVGLPSVRQIADDHFYADLPGGVLEAAGGLNSVENAPVPPPFHHVRDLLLEIGRIEPIRHYDERYLSIHTPEVRARIEAGDETWEALVPAVVADTIKARQLFGYQAPPAARR